jgi:hypothetical protein
LAFVKDWLIVIEFGNRKTIRKLIAVMATFDWFCLLRGGFPRQI